MAMVLGLGAVAFKLMKRPVIAGTTTGTSASTSSRASPFSSSNTKSTHTNASTSTSTHTNTNTITSNTNSFASRSSTSFSSATNNINTNTATATNTATNTTSSSHSDTSAWDQAREAYWKYDAERRKEEEERQQQWTERAEKVRHRFRQGDYFSQQQRHESNPQYHAWGSKSNPFESRDRMDDDAAFRSSTQSGTWFVDERERTARAILGLSTNPHVPLDLDDIKDHYRESAMRLHPDRPTGDAQAFQRITQAYQILVEKHKQQQTIRSNS